MSLTSLQIFPSITACFGDADPDAANAEYKTGQGSAMAGVLKSYAVIDIRTALQPFTYALSAASYTLNWVLNGSPATDYHAFRLLVTPTVNATWNRFNGVAAWPGSAGASTSGTDYEAGGVAFTAPDTSSSGSVQTIPSLLSMVNSTIAATGTLSLLLVADTVGAGVNVHDAITVQNPTVSSRPYLTLAGSFVPKARSRASIRSRARGSLLYH